MQIKICTREDISRLLEVFTQSYLEHYTYLWQDHGEFYVNTVLSQDKLTEELAEPNSVFFLVYDNGKPVGLAKLNVDHARGPYSAADALELERIYFLKEAAGKGLGKATVAYISDLARQKGKAVVWLKAMADNPSVGFYQKQGFTIAEETYLDYALLKDEFRKMVVMFKTL